MNQENNTGKNKITEVSQVFEKMARANEMVATELSQLMSRLSPVLRSFSPQSEDSLDNLKPNHSSPLAQEMDKEADSIEKAAATLKNILERLEL